MGTGAICYIINSTNEPKSSMKAPRENRSKTQQYEGMKRNEKAQKLYVPQLSNSPPWTILNVLVHIDLSMLI
ncbi:MAG: hypothetical protein EAZ34_03535 [Polaromonas sp.]|nr:MAG: hypothetical protein EAZ34_03535 [Polaromonas sp.]